MNNFEYIIILLILVLLMIIYGGPKKHNNKQIEFNKKNFSFINNLQLYKKYLLNFNDPNQTIINIDHKLYFNDFFIPNLVDVFIVNIKSFTFFNINDYVIDDVKKVMILMYNTNNYSLKLLLNYKKKDNTAIFYDIQKNISILDIYPIYNDGNEIVSITIFIIKKPYWFY